MKSKIFEDISKINIKNVKFGKRYYTPTKEQWNIYYQESRKSKNVKNVLEKGEQDVSMLKELYVVSRKMVVAWDKTYTNDDKTVNMEFFEEYDGDDSVLNQLEEMIKTLLE